MKKTMLILSATAALTFFACKKASNASQISLTPSATQVVVGQQTSVSVATDATLSNWTVTPSSNVTKAYSVTTSKVNYFTFNAAGVYTVSVATKKVAYDSTKQSISAAWNAGSRSSCTPGVDTASVAITVTAK